MNDVEVSISDDFREITVSLGNGHVAKSKEFMKFCFKGKLLRHEKEKRTTLAFSQEFIQSCGNTDELTTFRFVKTFNTSGEIETFDFEKFYKKFKEIYGVSASVLRKIITKKVLSEMVNDSEDFPNRSKYVNALCKGSSSNTKLPTLILLNRNKQLINSLEKDNLKNIIPVAFWFSRTMCPSGEIFEEFNNQPTKIMKKVFGKSLWKKLTKNTFTRNVLISKNSFSTEQLKLLMKLEIPSALLKYGNKQILEHSLRSILRSMDNLKNPNLSDDVNDSLIINKLKVFIKSYRVSNDLERRRMFRDIGMINDSLRLSFGRNHLFRNINFNHRTSLMEILLSHDVIVGIVREHDDRIRQVIMNNINTTKEQRLDFSWISKRFEKTGEVNKISYTILDSPELLRDEALKMSHCVDSYIQRVGLGNYLVVHLGEEAPKGITAGFVFVNNRMILDQAYGYDNEITSDLDDRVIRNLLEQLNKEYTTSLQESA